MLVQSPSELDPSVPEPDLLVVGAGTAGLYLATRARHFGMTVMVLESGTAIAHTGDAQDTAEAAGRAHRGTFEARARGLGGTSTLWGGQLCAFDDADFQRSYAPWPIDQIEIRSRERLVMEALGLPAPADDATFRLRLGDEHADPEAIVERFFTYWLPQPNFAQLFRKAIQEDQGLIVVLNAPVTGLGWDGARVREVEVGASIARRFFGHTVVLAPGTIAATRMLLAFAQRGPTAWARNPSLGRGFQDHLAGRAATVTLSDEALFRRRFENGKLGGVKVQPKIRLTPAERIRQPVDWPGMSGYFVFGSDFSEHLGHLKRAARAFGSAATLSALAEVPSSMAAVGRSLGPFIWRYVTKRRIMAFFDKSLEFQLQAEQIPSMESRIDLGSRIAADGLPSARVKWQVDGGELVAMRHFVRAAGQWFQREGMGHFALDAALEALDPSFIEGLVDTNHACGGARMGRSAADGVVDTNLKLFGTENLYLASAAVYPSSSHANCTFTLLCLAHRLAEHLGKHRQ